MAPSRRKGANKVSSAAAAAARRQWKVGDLVLAKVKGFPAWPATVSEPEKWGYSTDWKKVLVYFFGTKQIAFCHPTDVEAFTEEKKKCLLAKRHGKGAVFIRALEEIIENYEKSKNLDQVDKFNSGNAATVEGSMAKPRMKSEIRSPVEMLGSLLETSHASTKRNEPCDSIQVPSAAVEFIDSHDMDNVSVEPMGNTLILDKKPLMTPNSLRKRLRDTPLQNCVIQRRVPSVRRSRSSSRADPSKFQSLTMPVPGGSRSTSDSFPYVLRDEPIMNKRILKTLDTSVRPDVDLPDHASPTFVSNGSSDDNGSGIIVTNSDTLSLTGGSTLESSCKVDHPEFSIEHSERDVELSEVLDLQNKAVVLKKKRKPNRKRLAQDAAESTAGTGTVADLEVGISKTSPNSSDICEKLCVSESIARLDILATFEVGKGKTSPKIPNACLKLSAAEHTVTPDLAAASEVGLSKSSPKSPNAFEKESGRFCEVDGDKHLPLVKRARVRMGKPSPEGTANDFMKIQEKSSKKALVNPSCPVSRSFSCADDSLSNSTSLEVKDAMNNILPSKNNSHFIENGHLSWKVKGYKFCGSIDGEAALPPSKRLHRALEAMSVSAAEEGESIETPGTENMLFNSHMASSERSPSNSLDNKAGNAFEGQDVSSPSSGTFPNYECLTPSTSQALVKASSEVKACDFPTGNSISPKHEDCKDVFVEAKFNMIDKDFDGSSVNTPSTNTAIHVKSPKPCHRILMGSRLV